MARDNSNPGELRLPPIKPTSLFSTYDKQERNVLPPISELVADFFNPRLPPVSIPVENPTLQASYFSTWRPQPVSEIGPSKPSLPVENPATSEKKPQKKTQNAEASARSRVKRREREHQAKLLNASLNHEAQELEKKNKELCKELNGLEIEYKYLCADLEILTHSRNMDQELLFEIEREIEWSKLNSNAQASLHRPDPVGLAQRQLEATKLRYQSLLNKYNEIDKQRFNLDQCLIEQRVTQLSI